MAKISISIDMPDKVDDSYRYKSLEDKVKDYMDVCEGDDDSYYHWNYLKCVYNKIHKISKLNAAHKRILARLEDFMSKHAMYDSGDNQAQITGENMFKHLEDKKEEE